MISLLVLSGGIAGALVLSGLGARRTPKTPHAITVSKTLQPALQALRQRMLKSLVARPRTIQVPGPAVTGYACPAASGGPCGKSPCTVYASPGNGRFALAVPLRSSPCAKALAKTLPAMAR